MSSHCPVLSLLTTALHRRYLNTSYTIFAATVVIFFAARSTNSPEQSHWQELIQHSIEILETMNENVVARKAARIIADSLERLRQPQPSEVLPAEREDATADFPINDAMELQQSFPFDLANWDGSGMFPWANFLSMDSPPDL